jgi:hypothetical protein
MRDEMKYEPMSPDAVNFLRAAVAEETDEDYSGPNPEWTDAIGAELVRHGYAIPTVVEVQIDLAKIALAHHRLSKIRQHAEGYAASVMDIYGHEPEGQLWEDIRIIFGDPK